MKKNNGSNQSRIGDCLARANSPEWFDAEKALETTPNNGQVKVV
ncbi:MAG: hypothetical protein AB7U45_10750 [Desulfamplus sp.]